MPINYHLKDSPLPGLAGKIKLVQSATVMRYSKEQLAQEIVRQGTTVGEADVTAVLSNLGVAVAALCANGISVSIDNLGTFTPRVTGSTDEKGNWIKPLKARITVRPSSGLDRTFQELAQLKAIPAPKIRPIISKASETEISAGSLILLNGSYLRFHLDDPEEGVFLVPKEGPDVRLIEYVSNRYSEIAARVPAGTPPGAYRIVVRMRRPRCQRLTCSDGTTTLIVRPSDTAVSDSRK